MDDLDDSQFDPDFVVSFNEAQDDEQAADDAERHSTTGASGCLSMILLGLLALPLISAIWSDSRH